MTLNFAKNLIPLSLAFFAISGCIDTIKQKSKELQNCKAEIKYVRIVDSKMISFPPIPKIFFRAGVEVDNRNETPVTIERFEFDVSIKGSSGDVQIAFVKSEKTETIPRSTKQIIEVDMETKFESNSNRDLKEIMISILTQFATQNEIQYTLSGWLEVDTYLGKINIPFRQTAKSKVKI
ncbi:MAG: LEA type 2 family protein [Leptospira sp.]|nr:LEA type 2 family protein [Leptospira sp.]